MSAYRALPILLLPLLLAAGAVEARGQQRTVVPTERISEMRTSPDMVVQRVGPMGVDTLRDDRSITLNPGEVLVASAAVREWPLTRHSAGASRGHFDLPMRILARTRAGMRILVPTVQVGGLRYDSEERAFVGVVHVGLEDEERPHEQYDLDSPVWVQAIPTSGAVRPGTVEIENTYIPLRELRLVDSAPRDTIGVRILFANQSPVDIHVPVVRTALRIVPRHARINGFGLEKAEFSVAVPTELAVDSMTVSFSSASPLNRRSALATKIAPASATLQSRGFRGDTVWVEGPHYVAAGMATVDYMMPWLFLAAAVLGGLAGAALREALRRKRGIESVNLVWHGVAGVLIGLLIAVAYAVGVNLLPIPVTGPPVEAVIFVIAGLGAFLGGDVLRAAVGKGL